MLGKLLAMSALAVMATVGVLHADNVMAAEKKQKHCRIFTFDANQNRVCKEWMWVENDQIDNLGDPDQADNESEVADSGNEGPSSAAQESDQ